MPRWGLMMQTRKLLGCFAFCVGVATAGAGEVAKVSSEKQPAPEPRFKLSGWIESGITLNPDEPSDHQNVGHLFTDRSNELLLNQAVITAARTLDPKASGFDWAFKAQFMYG